MKRCTKCGEAKPLTEFFARRGAGDGLKSRCKPCHIEDRDDYRRHNAAKVAASQAARDAKPEAVAQRRAYAARNREAQKVRSANASAVRRGGTGRVSLAEWRDILARYGHRCFYCDQPSGRLTMDHYHPFRLGGRHEASNIRPACQPCNGRKGSKPPGEYIAGLPTSKRDRHAG